MLRFFSANNTLKSYYGPLLLRPLSFLRGLRCLFGDQTMFCRAADFRRVGGFDGRLPIMEDADLCIRLHMAGKPRRRRCCHVLLLLLPLLLHTARNSCGSLLPCSSRCLP